MPEPKPQPLTISYIMMDAHATSVKSQWWGPEKNRNFAESIALMHSELSEALEEDRKPPTDVTIQNGIYFKEDENSLSKPEGKAVELADCIIRICDICEGDGLDLERALALKLAYNKLRPPKHGGKKY